MLKSSTEKTIKVIRKHPSVLIGGVIIILLSSLITIINSSSILREFYSTVIRYENGLYKDIGLLATETNIKHFEKILGNPSYINTFFTTREYIFVNELFYTQAITDNNDKVLAFSITTRSKSFNPEVPLFNEIRLGETSFSELKKQSRLFLEADHLISYLGAHDLFYSEGYYLGNPGGYQTYFFSMSRSGYINYSEYAMPPSMYLSEEFAKSKSYTINITKQDINEYVTDNTNIINTYTVVGPFVEMEQIQEIREGSPFFYLFGPDNNQVRLLNY